jgi:hypothetical protein
MSTILLVGASLSACPKAQGLYTAGVGIPSFLGSSHVLAFGLFDWQQITALLEEFV